MESSVVPSPGGSSSPITRGIAAGTPTVTVPVCQRLDRGDLEMLDVTFGKSAGRFLRKETDEVPIAVAGVHDEYPLITVVSTPETPQVQVLEATGTSRLDELYKPHFQRLERALLASNGQEKAQAIQHHGSPLALMASSGQENAQAIQHHGSPLALMASSGQENAQAIQLYQVFPSSVTEGKVPELGVVGSGSGGELVFGSELVDRKAGKGK